MRTKKRRPSMRKPEGVLVPAPIHAVLAEAEPRFRELYALGLNADTLESVVRKGLSRVAAEQRFAAKRTAGGAS